MAKDEEVRSVLEDKKAIFAFIFIRGRVERWIKP